MVLYPEVQVKAQAEIDRVLDTNRLPSFSDNFSLPYIEAIVKESLRWNPVVPLGMYDFFTTPNWQHTKNTEYLNSRSSSVNHRRHLCRILSAERHARGSEHLVSITGSRHPLLRIDIECRQVNPSR